MDRTNYSGWQKLGSKTMDVKLKEKVDDILGTHKPELIDASLCKRMDKIIASLEA